MQAKRSHDLNRLPSLPVTMVQGVIATTPCPTVLCWAAQTAVFAVFERVHPSHPGGAAPLWRQLGVARLNGSELARGRSVVQEPRAARFVASRCAWARRNPCTAVAGLIGCLNTRNRNGAISKRSPDAMKWNPGELRSWISRCCVQATKSTREQTAR